MTKPVQVIAALCLAIKIAIGVTAPVTAASPTQRPFGVGVERFTATGPQDLMGRGLSDMLITDLFEALQDPSVKDCNIAEIEVQKRDEILKELALQQTPAFDPASRVTPNFLPQRFRINGSATTTETAIRIEYTVTDTRTGEVIGRHRVEFEPEKRDPIEVSQEAAREMVDRMCPPRHRLQLSVGPYFVIDTEVCDITRPFQARPKGGFGGVLVRFTPTSREAGSFVEGGRAYGAQWNGSGDYRISWAGASGRFVASNPNTARTTAGQTRNSDSMTGTVTRLPTRCRPQ